MDTILFLNILWKIIKKNLFSKYNAILKLGYLLKFELKVEYIYI